MSLSSTSFLDMSSWPKLETPKIKLNDKFKWPILIITGFIVSMWSNCLFVALVVGRSLDGTSVFIVIIEFITHVIISLSTTGSLISGLKHNEPDYLQPWMYLKGIELVGLFIGIVVQCATYYQYFLGLIPVGAIFIVIGAYLTACVYFTWKNIKNNHPPPTTNFNNTNHLDLEKPPSYESFTNQIIEA